MTKLQGTQSVFTASALQEKVVPELRTIAKGMGIKLSSNGKKLVKVELIDTILKLQLSQQEENSSSETVVEEQVIQSSTVLDVNSVQTLVKQAKQLLINCKDAHTLSNALSSINQAVDNLHLMVRNEKCNKLQINKMSMIMNTLKSLVKIHSRKVAF